MKHLLFIWRKIDNTVRDDDVYCLIRNRQMLDCGLGFGLQFVAPPHSACPLGSIYFSGLFCTYVYRFKLSGFVSSPSYVSSDINRLSSGGVEIRMLRLFCPVSRICYIDKSCIFWHRKLNLTSFWNQDHFSWTS